jgi:hypothetical protein
MGEADSRASHCAAKHKQDQWDEHDHQYHL